MLDRIQELPEMRAVITDNDDVAFWDMKSNNLLVLEDAAAVRSVVDDEIADRIQYEDKS